MKTPITDSTTARRASIAAAVVGCLALSACGNIAEKVTEEGAERIIESQGGGDVELDFDEDGSFKIETEDGGISVDENGNVVIVGEDGEVITGSVNDDGINLQNADGDGVLSVDGDLDGDDGQITIQGEGDDVYKVITGIPDEWPGDIPRPEGMTVEGGVFNRAGGQTLITVSGSAGSAADFMATYGAALEANGFTSTGNFESSNNGETSAQTSFENDMWTMTIGMYSDGSIEQVTVTIASQNF